MYDCRKLTTLRKKAKLSISALMFELDKIGCRISRYTLSKYEAGITEPRASTLEKIAKIYGVGVDFFYHDDKKEVK